MRILNTIKLTQTRLCLICCSLILTIFASLWVPISNSARISSKGFHFSMELSSSILAIIIGVFGIAYFITGGNTFSLIVGLGFFIAGSEDLVHGFQSINNSYNAPETYIIGRTILGILIILGITSERRVKKKNQIKFLSMILIPLSLIIVAVIMLNINLVPYNPINSSIGVSNFQDFILGLVFIAATITSIIRLSKKNDIITFFLSISVILMAVGQIYLSFSITHNDMFFIASHFCVFFSYTIMITGLLTFIFNQYRALIAVKLELKKKETYLEQERSQLLSIFNNIDDLIYVVDPENSRILFANKSMENAFGKSLKGKICYKEICGLDYRCSHCILSSNKSSIRKNEKEFNKILDKSFSAAESYIKWPDGKDVVFHVLSDVSQITESKNKLEETLNQTIRLNELMIKREKRIIEMKREVNSLLLELNREKKYKNTDI